MMLRRQVVEVVSNVGLKYALKLECGHVVTRRDSGRRYPPKSTYCDECVMVVERLERAEGLISTQDARATRTTLRFLEDEGLVEGRRPVSSQTVYWKRAGRRD